MTSSAESIAQARSRNAAEELSADPLGPIRLLGERAVRVGLVLGAIGALLLHGAIAAQAAATLGDIHAFAVLVRAEIRDRLSSQVDVDLSEPPPPPPPEAPPEPQPQAPPPVAAPPAPPTNTPPPPPTAAEAGKVLTADPDPNAPVDLTGDGFVTGNGDRFAGGVTAANGTSKDAVHDLRAKPDGIAKAPPGPIAAVVSPSNLSRSAAPVAASWNCDFPAEADVEGIDNAVVQLTVLVAADGHAKSVTVLRDPGNGFGQAARSCAFRKQFTPALDQAGSAVTMSTAPFTVRFTR